MSVTATGSATGAIHRIASNRSLDTLLGWSAELVEDEASAGKRVIYAPCHALRGAVSLRSYVLSLARATLGESAPEDAPTLLSGAADTLVIADPASGDPASLRWLGNLLACARAADGMTPTPPMPSLVVLTPSGTESEAKVAELLSKLQALGSKDEKVAGRPADPAPAEIETEIAALKEKYKALLASLALMPCPLSVEAVEALARETRSGSGAVAALTGGNLFRVISDQVMPLNAEVVSVLRDAFSPEELKDGASRMLTLVERELPDIPDAVVEVLLYAGDSRRAIRVARTQFEQHVANEQYEEALRIMRAANKLGITLESGKHAEFIDQAALAAMLAETGHYREARDIVDAFARRRELYGLQPFIEWLALAARRLAIDTGFEPRTADSLMRRAIRLARKDTDRWVQLRLLRVELLRSEVFNLEERADWLLSHVSNKILDKVSDKTLVAFLDEMATRMFAKGDFKGAFKRLRRIGALPTTDERRGRTFLMMARCRAKFKDHEAAQRYGASALHFGIRAAQLGTVTAAAEFLRELEKDRPRRLPKLTPPAKARGTRPRLPAVADIATPSSPESSQLFEILETRFNVVRWIRRRGSAAEFLGEDTGDMTDALNVYHANESGEVHRLAWCGDPDEIRALVLTRPDGSDMVVYHPASDADAREDAIIQFLLTDRAGTAPLDRASTLPARKTLVDEYMRRALDWGIRRGLHHTMETLFNKDVLIFFEEQGYSKEEMAEKLGVSRATLYRMYARAGLN